MAEELESAREAESAVTVWRQRIQLASKTEAGWRKGAREIVKRYRDEKRKSGRKFNILWSNVETLKPAVYSNTPQPDVRRRYRDPDPVARQAAEVLERALSAAIDSTEDDDDSFDATMEAARDDMLLPGRGMVRVRYEANFERVEPVIEPVMAADPETREQVIVGSRFLVDGEEVEPEFDDDDEERQRPFVDRKVSERVWAEYVFWEDVRLGAARMWKDVPWIAFRHFMSRDDLKKSFGDSAAEVPLIATRQVGKEDDPAKPPADVFKLAVVWEIFDKDDRKRLFIADGHHEVIEEEDDPLELRQFFPTPKPLYAYKTTDSMVPIPEFTQYQDQADELDEVTARINLLVRELKAKGLYDAAVKEIIDLKSASDGEMLPIDTAEKLRQNGGLDQAIFMWPLQEIARAIVVLIDHRNRLKQEIFELTGLSDIIRGSTDPRETKGAQQLKAGFGKMRMTPRQKPMALFARDTLRLMAELMAENFDAATFEQMTGLQVTDEVMAVLREDKLRQFRVDIETDSTVQPDAEVEKAEAVELLSSVTGYLEQSAAIAQAAPTVVPMLMELLKFGLRRFKISRTLEQQLDEMAETLVQQASQPQQQQQQDPEVLKLEQDGQLRQAEMEQDARLTIREQDIDARLTARGQDIKARSAA